MLKRLTIFMLTSLCIFFASVAYAAESDYVYAQGEGITKEAALHDAMRKAVEKKVGVLLSSDTMTEKAVVIRDSIYAHSDGYIADYTIIDEKNNNGQYTISIKALVKSVLNDDLMKILNRDVVVDNLQDPRFGVIIIEPNGCECDGAENMAVTALQQNKFTHILDMNQVDEIQKRQLLSSLIQEDYGEVQSLLTQFPTDYMIVGKLEYPNSGHRIRIPGYQNFINATVIFTARVYNTSTGEIVFAGVSNSTAMHVDYLSALQRAIGSSVSKLLPSMMQSIMKKGATPYQSIHLQVSNSRLGTEDVALNYLRSLPGVRTAYLRNSINGFQTFDVEYYGDAASLAMTLKKNNVNVIEMTSNYMKV